MKNSKFTILWIAAIVLITFASCSKDDESVDSEDSNSGYAVWLITDSEDFSGMLITTDSMFNGVIEPTDESYTLLGMARNAGISYEGAIYNVHNTAGDPGLQKFSYENNTLTDEGFISVGESFFMFELISETKGYYTDADLSRTGIQTFNPTTMERTGEIDITDAMEPYMSDKVAMTRLGSFMLESEGYLYTQVFFLDETGLINVYDSTFVAVFNVETDEFVNMAIHPDYLYLGYERKNMSYVSKAENGDLYLASLSGNRTERQQSRCLRIKAGETEFDSWKLDYNTIIGEEGSFSLGGPTILNGKMYIRLKETGMAMDYSNMNEENMVAYEVDIETKVATKIEAIPASSSSVLNSVDGPVVIDGLVYYVVSTPSYQGYYSYNPETGDANEVFSFTGGIPSQFIEIE